MSSDDPTYLSGVEMHAAFVAGSLLPSDLMSQAIARAELAHSQYNCFTETYFDQARDAAKLADQRFANGTARPLEGLPLAVKEEFRLAGTRRTSSSLLYMDRIDDETDVYIQRLLDAGAIPIAKTTTPEFCILGTTHSRAFGVTRNPWNDDFTPGGSSGGSAVALATGAAAIATGSDIGGSIRIPASACGVVGYKPPYGRNPDIAVYNLDYYCQSGPLARSVADCALMQNVTSGQDVSDIASLRDRVVLNFDAPPDIRDWRIAFSVDFGFLDIEDAVRANTLAALTMLADLGAEIEEVDLGWTREQLYASDDHLDHLSGTGLARLLDDHRGELCDYTIAAAEAARNSTADGFLAADEAAIEMYRTFGPLLETHDAFICPGLAVAAPPAENSLCNEEVIFNGEARTMRAADWEITRLFNMLSRCPVLSVPSGFAPNGVPTGIQIVAKAYHDEKVFEVGRALEQAANWYADPSARPKIEALP